MRAIECKSAGLRGEEPARRLYGFATSEAELHAHLNLVGLGQRSADRFAGKAAEARIFEPQAKRWRNVVTDADAIVHPVAQPSRIADRQRCHRVRRNVIALRIAEPAIQRE